MSFKSKTNQQTFLSLNLNNQKYFYTKFYYFFKKPVFQQKTTVLRIFDIYAKKSWPFVTKVNQQIHLHGHGIAKNN